LKEFGDKVADKAADLVEKVTDKVEDAKHAPCITKCKAECGEAPTQVAKKILHASKLEGCILAKCGKEAIASFKNALVNAAKKVSDTVQKGGEKVAEAVTDSFNKAKEIGQKIKDKIFPSSSSNKKKN